jgi:oligosaccharide reducing-end xylanase
MNLAYNYGARKIWIVNVGDLKPMEFPMEFFMTFAREPQKWPKERISEYTKLWAQREFGPKYAEDIADIMAKYTKYNARRKPELVDTNTFSIVNYNEADRVVAEWKAITSRAEQIYAAMPASAKDAFFELVLYPTKGSAIVTELYVAAAKNRLDAEEKRPETNAMAEKVRELFKADAELTRYYNRELAGGKWDHLADTTHIGYTSWNPPAKNIMPEVREINVFDGQAEIKASQTKPSEPNVDSLKGFVEADGYVSMEAEHYTKKIDAGGVSWERIDDYGRTDSAMSIFPVTAGSVTPPKDSPCLEYKMYLFSKGKVEVETIMSPTLNFVPDRDFRYAVSFDDESPRIITIVPKNYVVAYSNEDWQETVRRNARIIKTEHILPEAGYHTLKIWMVDPGVVLEKIIIDTGGLKPSYLGPPESYRNTKSKAAENNPDGSGGFATGKYRNLFVEAGHSEKEVREKVNAAFEQLFCGDPCTQAVYYPAGSNANGSLAYILDTGSNDVRSEGMSYGMMIAVQMDKKAEFDALWNWAKTYMYHDSPNHPAYGFFTWSARTDGRPNDEMPAADGEEYFATALYFAGNLWGSGEGIYNYKAQADRLLSDMKNRSLIAGPTVKGEMTAGGLFDIEHKMVRFTPDVVNMNHTDPSYHLPAFYELWARWGPATDREFWTLTAEASREFFQRVTNPVTGLSPDYANFDGSPWASPWNSKSADFQFDSWRTAMNWSVDWAWWGKDARERQLSDRLQKFFASKGMSSYGNQFTLDGKHFGSEHSTGLAAANAVAGLAAEGPQAKEFVEALWNTPIPTGQYRYYDGMLYMLAALHCSGEFRIVQPK